MTRIPPESTPESTPETRPNPPPPGPDADFANDLFIADRPGTEFASIARARILAPGVGSMLFMPIVGLAAFAYPIATGPFRVPPVPALIACAALGAVALVFAYANAVRAGRHKSPAWTPFSPQSTDTRYRLRAVIPKSQRTNALGRWAMRATGVREERFPGPGRGLEPERGGFEPVILRPWLGITRQRGYRVVFYSTACTLGALLLAFAHFSLGSVLEPLRGLRAWGVMALIAACSIVAAEFLYPVFVRLSPGRLDVFRYALFGRGPPEVTTYDLTTAGLCVNFQTATIAIEPPRPPGEPLPKLVLSNKWPHFQTHPQGTAPRYLSVALCPGRTEFCQRVIQAARTTEPTPPLPDDQLLG